MNAFQFTLGFVWRADNIANEIVITPPSSRPQARISLILCCFKFASFMQKCAS